MVRIEIGNSSTVGFIPNTGTITADDASIDISGRRPALPGIGDPAKLA
jgi:hypothetical protein